MRGARFPPAWALWSAGIIPAYAGSTRVVLEDRKVSQDHPRVCGEHVDHLQVQKIWTGSSPRMRGARSLLLG